MKNKILILVLLFYVPFCKTIDISQESLSELDYYLAKLEKKEIILSEYEMYYILKTNRKVLVNLLKENEILKNEIKELRSEKEGNKYLKYFGFFSSGFLIGFIAKWLLLK